MMTKKQEKWIVRWYDSVTGRQAGQMTFYDENATIRFIKRKLKEKENWIVEDEFFPDG